MKCSKKGSGNQQLYHKIFNSWIKHHLMMSLKRRDFIICIMAPIVSITSIIYPHNSLLTCLFNKAFIQFPPQITHWHRILSLKECSNIRILLLFWQNSYDIKNHSRKSIQLIAVMKHKNWMEPPGVDRQNKRKKC